MPKSIDATMHWLSVRTKTLCVVIFVVSTLLPPYIPRAALAPAEVAHTQQQFLLVEEGFLMKSSSLTRQGSRRAYAEGSYHTVKEGESLEKLANRYAISVETIKWANDLNAGVAIQPGQELLILPVDGVLHTVKRGQTLLGIAELYGIELDNISKRNKIQGGFILAGQELIIPEGTPIVSVPKPVIAVQPKPAQPTTEPSDQPSKPAEPTQPPPAQPDKPTEFVSQPRGGVLQMPCSSECFITQYFHGGHYALDLQDKNDPRPIYSAEAGTVTRSDLGWNGGYGNVIEIDHGNGLTTLYAHNKSLDVKVGDFVSRGQRIAEMGATGLVYGATGIHIHFEVRVHGVKKNPLLYVQ